MRIVSIKQFAARLSDAEYNALAEEGKTQERSMNALLREAVRQYLEQMQKKPS